MSGLPEAVLGPDGALCLQRCAACGSVAYPPRAVCGECLSGALHWKAVDGSGHVVATTRLFASLSQSFRTAHGWPLASVRLTLQVTVLAHNGLNPRAKAGDKVRVRPARDARGQVCLVALPPRWAGTDPWDRLAAPA